MFGRFGPSGIYGYAVASRIKRPSDGKCQFPVRSADQWIMAPEKNRPGFDISIVISDHKTAIGKTAYGNAGNEAVGQSGFIPVGSTKSIGKTYGVHVMVPACSLPDGN